MLTLRDPNLSTPAARLGEIANILAGGILRLHVRSVLASNVDSLGDEDIFLDPAAAGLEFSPKTVLSVQRG